MLSSTHETTYPPFPPYRGAYKSRMAEWAVPRAALTTPAKFWAAQLDAAHAQFIDGRLDLEAYSEQLFEYLERDNGEADVIAFLTDVAPLIETGRFNPAKGKFSTFLRKRYSAWADLAGVARPVVDEVVVPIVEEASTELVALTPANVTAAYREYLDGIEGAEDRLYALIFRVCLRFAKHRMADRINYLDLPADAAQAATISIWRAIGRYKVKDTADADKVAGYDTANKFYYWVRLMAYNTIRDSIAGNVKVADLHIPLQVASKDDPGQLEDNPELYPDEQVQYARALPDWIQGTDKLILGYIYQGHSYKKIASNLELTEAAVEARVRRMRKRVLSA